MKDKTYEVLRTIAMLIAPIAAFIAVLCNAWNIPYAQPIAMTLAGLDALMGAVVEVLRNKWKVTHPEIYQEDEDFGEE